MAKQKRTKRVHPCPICSGPRHKSGLPLTVPFGIPTYWSPDEALAIFEFIDEMRDVIIAVYRDHLHDTARRQYQPPPDDRLVIPEEELPF